MMYKDPSQQGPDPQVYVSRKEFYEEMTSLRRDIFDDRERNNDTLVEKLDSAIQRGCQDDIDELKGDVKRLEENARKSNIISATVGAVALAFVAWFRGG